LLTGFILEDEFRTSGGVLKDLISGGAGFLEKYGGARKALREGV